VDFEPWWLIFIPVVFALGWIAARVDIRQMLSETRSLPKSYFKGLNFLLNEEPDHAIDAFIEVAKIDPETTELHFALGNLFRRRGEMERAIRVHQSLLSRADLPPSEREHALNELGHDFLKAGLLDRAEQAFEQLQQTRFAIPAVKALIRIYESEHDWPRAIAAVKRLRALVDEPVPQLAHYQCERAQAALTAQPADLAAAAEALDEADYVVQSLRRHGAAEPYGVQARIAMLYALQARLSGDAEAERLSLESILENAPAYAGLIAADLLESYRRAGRTGEGLQLLREHHARYPSLDVFGVVLRELRTQGREAAWDFAREALRRGPSLLGLDRVLAVELDGQKAAGDKAAHETAHETADANTAPAHTAADAALTRTARQTQALPSLAQSADLGLLHSLIRRHTQLLDRYACRQCGFQARHFYWQCPGCHAWETYTPRRLEEQR